VWPAQITVPVGIIGVPAINYRETMQRGRASMNPTITLLVSQNLTVEGQRALRAYADMTGANSIIAAVEGDKTLGGVVDDCVVWDYRELGLEQVGQIGYYGGLFTLRVLLTGS
jgi:hypothetical protein